jgi:hypothetical protein
MPILGIQLMMKANFIKENQILQSQQLEENQFNLVMLSSFFQEDIEEEELLF